MAKGNVARRVSECRRTSDRNVSKNRKNVYFTDLKWSIWFLVLRYKTFYFDISLNVMQLLVTPSSSIGGLREKG